MDIKGFKAISESLRLYHRITDEKYNDASENDDKKMIDKLYVDILPSNGILEKMLERNATYIVGRRGTGKSTIIAKAQSNIQKEKKYMSIYLNAKSIYKSVEVDRLPFSGDSIKLFSQDELFKVELVRRTIKVLCENMKEELSKEEYGLVQKISNMIVRDKKIDQITNDLDKMLKEEVYLKIDKILSEQKNEENREKIVVGLKASLNDFGTSVEATDEASINRSSNYTLARVFDVSKLINKFLEVIKICNRKGLYIFLDDYSELSLSERTILMNEVILPFYHIGVDKIYFKIACYPNRITPLSLDAQKYSIKYIDYYEVYGIDKNLTQMEKDAEDFIKRLLTNSCKVFSTGRIEDYFDLSSNSIDQYYMELHRMSMNIPRVIGHILNNCYLKRIVHGKKINMSVLKEACKQYYIDYVMQEIENKIMSLDLSKESKIDIYVQKHLLERLKELAIENKITLTKTPNQYFRNHKEVPTSHFRISTENEIYFEELEFYGYVHKITEIADKGSAKDITNKNTSLYSFDYGLCLDEKIDYGKPIDSDTKYYQQRAFLYDECVISAITKNKKIVCEGCKAEYNIDKLDIFKMFKMKCQKCTSGVCTIHYDKDLTEEAEKSYETAIWTLQEIEIIKAISRLEQIESTEWLSANYISREIDLSSYVIAARCRELAKASFIERNEDITPYKYSLTTRSRGILSQSAQ